MLGVAAELEEGGSSGAMPTINVGAEIVVSFRDTDMKNFLDKIRRLRIQFLGLEQAALVLGRVGEALTKIGTIGIKGLGALIKPAAQFDDTMTRIAAVSGFSDQKITGLSESFLALSSTLPLSAQQLAEVGVEAVKAGVKSAEAIKSIALVSGKLAAVSSDLTEAQAAKAIAAISSQFQISSEDMAANATRLGNAFTVFKDVGIGTAGELVNITKRMGQTAKVIGLSQEQTIGFAAALRKMGVQVEVIGTSMSQLFTKLTSDTAKFAAAAGLTTEELEDLINSQQGFVAIQRVLNGITRNGTASVTEMGARFKELGIRGVRPLSVLIGLATNMESLNEVMALGGATTGALEKQFTIFSTSLQQQINTLRGSADNLLISFKDAIKPAIVATIQVFVFLLDVLTKIPTPIKVIIAAFVLLTSVLFLVAGGVIGLVAALLTAVSSGFFLFLAFKALGQAASDAEFKVTLLAKKVVLLSRANVAATASTTALATSQKLLPSLVTKATNALTKFLPAGVGAATALAVFKSFLLAAGVALLKVAVVVGPIIGFIILFKDEISELGSAIVELFAPIGTLLSGLADLGGEGSGLIDVLFLLGKIIFLKIFLAFKAVVFVLKVFAAIFRGVVSAVLKGLAPLTAVFNRLRRGFRNIAEDFTALGRRLGLVSKKVGFLESVFKGLEKITNAVLVPFIRAIAFLVEVVLAVFAGVIEGVLRALGPLFQDLIQIGDEIAAVFAEIAFAFEPLFEVFREISKELGFTEEGFDFFGIIVQATAAIIRIALTPIILILRVLLFLVDFVVREWAAMARGFVDFIKPAIDGLTDMGKKFASILELIDRFGGGIGSLSDAIKFFFEGVGDLADGVAGDIVGVFVKAAELITDLFGDTEEAAGKAVKSVAKTAAKTAAEEGGFFSKSPSTRANDLTFFGAAAAAIFFAPSKEAQGFAHGGAGNRNKSTLAILHPEEAVVPFRRIPELALGFQQAEARATGAVPPPAAARAPSGEGGAAANVSITVPVTLMLDGMTLGSVIARVSEEQIRRAFGTRGVRLAGVG